MTLMTSIAEIRSFGPFHSGLAKIRTHFGVSAADAKTHASPFTVVLMLETNDIWEALWVFERVAPQPMKDTFLIYRLDRGEYSALKSLRLTPVDSGWWRACEASIQRIVTLLNRRISGDDVTAEMRTAADAARRAAAAARAAVYTAANAAACAAAHAAGYAAANAATGACAAAATAACAAAACAAAATAACAAAACARTDARPFAARDLIIIMEASI
jgi:hypothetical protein